MGRTRSRNLARAAGSISVGGLLLAGAVSFALAGQAAAADPTGQAPSPPAGGVEAPEALTPEAPKAPAVSFDRKADRKKSKKGSGSGLGQLPPEDPADPGDSEKPPAKPAAAKLSLKIHGLRGGKIPVGTKIKAIGRIKPFVPGQKVRIKLLRRGKTLKVGSSRIKPANGNRGRFTLRSPRLVKPGGYRFVVKKRRSNKQKGGYEKTKKAKISYPDLDPGQKNSKVRLLRKLLKRQGYYAKSGSKYDSRTERAILAFRKVNKMSLSTNANKKIFKRLAAGKGAFKPKYPGAGHHVEVDFSRQVMALVSKGKARHTFHVSTGAPATPSDFGHFRFYRKDPGYNSLGMYYSVYYNRGEATHGYHSVPTYPASHGCIRNPIPDAVFIYNWIDLGDSMYVYH